MSRAPLVVALALGILCMGARGCRRGGGGSGTGYEPWHLPLYTTSESTLDEDAYAQATFLLTTSTSGSGPDRTTTIVSIEFSFSLGLGSYSFYEVVLAAAEGNGPTVFAKSDYTDVNGDASERVTLPTETDYSRYTFVVRDESRRILVQGEVPDLQADRRRHRWTAKDRMEKGRSIVRIKRSAQSVLFSVREEMWFQLERFPRGKTAVLQFLDTRSGGMVEVATLPIDPEGEAFAGFPTSYWTTMEWIPGDLTTLPLDATAMWTLKGRPYRVLVEGETVIEGEIP